MERDHSLNRYSILQHNNPRSRKAARKSNQLHEQLIQDFEEHDKDKEVIIKTLEKQFQKLQHKSNTRHTSENHTIYKKTQQTKKRNVWNAKK